MFLFCLIFLAPKVTTPNVRKKLAVFAALLVSFGSVAITLPIDDVSVKLSLVITGIIFTGLGNAALTISWGVLWSGVDVDRIGLHIVVSNLFAGCVYLAVSPLPSIVQILIIIILPICSAATLILSDNEPPRKHPVTSQRSGPMLAKALVAICVFAFAFGIGRAYFSPANAASFASVQTFSILGECMLSVAILAAVLTVPKQKIPIRLYRLTTPLMAIGFAFLPFLPDNYKWVSFSAILCGFHSFEGLVWLLQPEFALNTKSHKFVVFGWGKSLQYFFGFIGVTCGFLILASGAQFDDHFSALCVTVCALLIIVSTYVFTEYDLRLFIEPRNVIAKRELGNNALLHDKAADKYGLSTREKEVVILLEKGKSAPVIAEVLFISKSTVKTHMRHIYEKMQVHSKQELLSLLESEQELQD